MEYKKRYYDPLFTNEFVHNMVVVHNGNRKEAYEAIDIIRKRVKKDIDKLSKMR